LDRLPPRCWAQVLDVAHPPDGQARQLVLRLTEIGFVPGEPVCVMARGAPGGDPLAVRVGHTPFALRRHEAALVQVAPQNTAPEQITRSTPEPVRA
ncbi:MAG: FeoA domain-containing protein, partial [Burkholderiaceae bacterium]|nr:FeoA domain-containing protein [Burkholderiaceae bacterium]